ncbi:MAG: DUF2207 domain-containing protein [Candidatus Nanopelagicales bacterium]
MRIPKLRLFLVLLLAAAVVAGWAGMYPVPFKNVFNGLSSSTGPGDTSIIDRYEADYDLQSDGELAITERIDVDFTTFGKHGIFRIFDTQDSQDSTVEHPVEVVSVERKQGGEWTPEPYVVSQEGGGTMTIRIGSANRTLDLGIQKYRIISTTSNAITPPTDGPEGAGSQWYWDVVGSGWAMEMRDVEVAATIPDTIAAPACEASVPCQIRDEAGQYRISTKDLPAYTPITMKAFFADEAPGAKRSALQYLSVLAALAVLLLSLFLTVRTYVRSRERRPNIELRFEPPGPDPLLSAWTLDESPVSRAVPAVLLNLVAHKVLDFQAEQRSVQDDKGPDWIMLTRTNAPVPPLVGFDAALRSLGLVVPGATVTIRKASVSDGKLLAQLNKQIAGEITGAALGGGYANRVGGSGMALFLIYASIIGAFTALIWLRLGLIVATLLLVAAIVGLIINRRDTTQRTDMGAQMRDATEGFKKVLSTTASMERFDYAARIRHFDEYLPWAVALDCADEWAASCTPPPGSPEASMAATSGLYASPTMTSQMWALSTGVVAVEASAVAAYQATQSSSSGGGGGGGGGGSGGGGGGSW